MALYWVGGLLIWTQVVTMGHIVGTTIRAVLLQKEGLLDPLLPCISVAYERLSDPRRRGIRL